MSATDRYILRGTTPVACENVTEWAEWWENPDNRRVADDEPMPGVRVSTVFLGIDHSFGAEAPILFETMTFGGAQDGYQARYHTWDEAVIGHSWAVVWCLTGYSLSGLLGEA